MEMAFPESGGHLGIDRSSRFRKHPATIPKRNSSVYDKTDVKKSLFPLSLCILSYLLLAACSRYAEEPSRVSTRSPKPRSSPSQQSPAGPETTAAELFDLSPGQWEIMTEKDRRTHLESLIREYESRSPDDPVRTRKFPALYFALATLLSRSGEGVEALKILDRIPLHPQTDSLLHLVRGQVYQSMSNPVKAMGSYLASFSMDAQPWTWQRLDSVAKQLGYSQQQTLEQVRGLLLQQARAFPSFELATPQGQKKTLTDFSNQAILVNFFFPG